MIIDYNKNYFLNYYPKRIEDLTASDIQKIRNWFWGWYKFLSKYIKLADGNNRKVLEIGCAIGGFASILQEHNFNVYASDFSTYVLEHAKKLWPNITFLQLDIQKEIGIQEQFDYIFAFEVIEHLENPQQAIANMRQKLSPNGVLICSTPPPYQKFVDIKGHINIKNAPEWQKILEQAGFRKENIQIENASFLPFLYRYSKHLSIAFPLKVNLPYFNSTFFLIAKNNAI